MAPLRAGSNAANPTRALRSLGGATSKRSKRALRSLGYRCRRNTLVVIVCQLGFDSLRTLGSDRRAADSARLQGARRGGAGGVLRGKHSADRVRRALDGQPFKGMHINLVRGTNARGAVTRFILALCRSGMWGTRYRGRISGWCNALGRRPGTLSAGDGPTRSYSDPILFAVDPELIADPPLRIGCCGS